MGRSSIWIRYQSWSNFICLQPLDFIFQKFASLSFVMQFKLQYSYLMLIFLQYVCGSKHNLLSGGHLVFWLLRWYYLWGFNWIGGIVRRWFRCESLLSILRNLVGRFGFNPIFIWHWCPSSNLFDRYCYFLRCIAIYWEFFGVNSFSWANLRSNC